MKTQTYQTRIAVGLCISTLAAATRLFAGSGGPILPPGTAGADLLKTLDEVEPRTPISALPFTISQPGSYYVTTNLTAAGPGVNGISISASDVTLDLRGFALIGLGGGGGDGINVFVAVTNVSVRNGTVRGWGGRGVDGDTAFNSQLIEIRASQNGTDGMSLGAGGIVMGCTARANTQDGIETLGICTVSGCSSTFNTGDGITAAAGSTVTGCSSSSNGDDGIVGGDGCIMTGNAASGNTGDGIQVANDSQVANNNCDGNGAGAGSGAGIHATGSDSSIEANNVTDNDRGLDFDAAGNSAANNTVRRNTVNYDFVQGNQLNLLLSQIPQTISWPCDVVLAGALIGTAANNGITVAANDVTIDLGGHALLGVTNSLDGVSVSGSRTNVTVRNGAIRGWGSDGVQAASAFNSQFVDLKVASCGANGIQAGLGSSVKGCSARANGADGITTSSGCNITDCTAAQNRSDGIVANSGSAVTGCNAFDNVAVGIIVSDGSTVLNSSAYSNTNGIVASSGSTVTGCTAASNATNGIVTAFGATVSGCTCRDNRTGINVGDDSRIVDNECDQNILGIGTGILINGSDNRIDGNHVTDNATGINCTGTGNLIIRNSAAGNTAHYSIVAGNNFGAILVSPGAAFAATNPWNNFQY